MLLLCYTKKEDGKVFLNNTTILLTFFNKKVQSLTILFSDILLQAQQITLTIAQSFNLAFEIWQNSSLEKDTSDHFGASENVRVIIGSTDSAKSCSSSGSSNTNHNTIDDIRSGQWVHFDEVDEIANAIDSFNMVTLAAPFPQPEKSRTTPSRQQQSNLPNHEDLLICLN